MQVFDRVPTLILGISICYLSYLVMSQVLDVAGEGDVASDGRGVVRNTSRELG